MAIVRTNISSTLVGSLIDGIEAALHAGGDFAEDVGELAGNMAAISPKLSDEGSYGEGMYWKTLIGSTSASYVYTRTSGSSVPSVYEPVHQGVSKYSFSGSNLDGANALAAQLATRFSLSATSTARLLAPGQLVDGSSSRTIAAKIDFDLLAPTELNIFDFTSSTTQKMFASGSNVDGGESVGSLKHSVSFAGESLYEFVDGDWDLVSATLKSYSAKYSGSQASEYTYPNGGTQDTATGLFQLTSGPGLEYSLAAGGSGVLGGDISSLTYSTQQTQSRSMEGDSYSLTQQTYYRYTNTASPADNLDLAVLARYMDVGDNADAVYAEFFKGNDIITVTGGLPSLIDAGAGNDKVVGGGGNDFIEGGSGDDLLKGGAAQDYLAGDEGNDTLDGGTGNDELHGGLGNDRLLGGAGHDRIFAGEGNDFIDGGVGNDWVFAGLGQDTLKGGAGQDYLYGEAGDDIIDGGAGNDLITGGLGRDLLSGGSGVDGFAFGWGDSGDGGLSLASLDQIKDFNVAQDRLQFYGMSGEVYVLTSSDTAELGRANSYAALLVAAQAANAAGAGYVVGYDNGNTYVFADLDGNDTLDIAVQLVGIKGDAVANALVIDQFSAG